MAKPAEKKATMFELEMQLEQALDAIGEAGDEADADTADMLWRAIDDAADKRDAVAMKISNIDRDAAKFRDYARMFTDRARIYENRAKRIRQMVLELMGVSNRTAMDGEAFQLRRRMNPDHVEITDLEALCRKGHGFVEEKVTYTPNKNLIKDAIEAGATVPGAELVHGDWRLEIKPR